MLKGIPKKALILLILLVTTVSVLAMTVRYVPEGYYGIYDNKGKPQLICGPDVKLSFPGSDFTIIPSGTIHSVFEYRRKVSAGSEAVKGNYSLEIDYVISKEGALGLYRKTREPVKIGELLTAIVAFQYRIALDEALINCVNASDNSKCESEQLESETALAANPWLEKNYGIFVRGVKIEKNC